MARFFGYFRYEPAMEVLRHEAAARDSEAAVASLQALAAMGDIQSLPTFRNIVRSGNDCKAMRIAATALGRWRDHASYSALLASLLRPRCEGVAVVALMRALTQVSHPYIEDYLFMIHQVSTSPTARLAAASALSMQAMGPRRNPVRTTLQEALENADPLSDGYSMVLSLWGLGRFSHRVCISARDQVMKRFEKATGEERREVARQVLLAGLPCLRTTLPSHVKMIKELVGEARDESLTMASVERRSAAKKLPAPRAGSELLEPEWVDWLVQLATRFTLWDETRSVAHFAQAVERVERVQSRARTRKPSQNLSVDRTVRVPKPTQRSLKKLAADWKPPEDFFQYDFTPGQPDWWPEYIDITIDDGPRPARLKRYLEVFDEWGVKATFFFIGVNIVRYWTIYPERARELLSRVIDSGHRIGYHSMSHQTSWYRHLQAWTPRQILDDIRLYEAILTMALGRQLDLVWGRLPGGMGRHLRHVHMGFDMGGLKGHVHWNVQDPTWGPSSSSGDIKGLARRLVREKEPAVILLHEYEGLQRQLNVFIKTVHQEVTREARR